jgi:hypothetical protein
VTTKAHARATGHRHRDPPVIVGIVRLQVDGDEPDHTLLADFKRMTFASIPTEERSSLERQIEVLIAKATELRQIAENTTSTKTEVNEAIVDWCKGWLGLACEGNAFLRHTSVQYGLAFFTHIDKAVVSLSRRVEAVLFEAQSKE